MPKKCQSRRKGHALKISLKLAYFFELGKYFNIFFVNKKIFFCMSLINNNVAKSQLLPYYFDFAL